MSYDDFLESFGQVHFNTAACGGKFDSEPFDFSKRAAVFSVQIKREGEYMFELGQPKHKNKDDEE